MLKPFKRIVNKFGNYLYKLKIKRYVWGVLVEKDSHKIYFFACKYIGIIIYISFMVFHRILDKKRGWISILASLLNSILINLLKKQLPFIKYIIYEC